MLCYPVPGHPARRARARRAGLDNITQDRDDLKNASEDFVRERDAHNSLRSELQLGQGRAQQEQQGRRKLEQQLPDIYYNGFPLGLQLLFAESVEEDVEVDLDGGGKQESLQLLFAADEEDAGVGHAREMLANQPMPL